MKPQQLMSARRPPYGRENGMSHQNRRILEPVRVDTVSGLRRSCDRTDSDPLDRPRAADAIAAAGPLNVKQVLDFPTPSEPQLRALLDLTVAEARLARLLASGDTLEVVAQKLCIKLTTARSQLAAIFSKTGIRRQAKLVAILSRIAHLEYAQSQAGHRDVALRASRFAVAVTGLPAADRFPWDGVNRHPDTTCARRKEDSRSDHVPEENMQAACAFATGGSAGCRSTTPQASFGTSAFCRCIFRIDAAVRRRDVHAATSCSSQRASGDKHEAARADLRANPDTAMTSGQIMTTRC